MPVAGITSFGHPEEKSNDDAGPYRLHGECLIMSVREGNLSTVGERDAGWTDRRT